MASQPSIVSSTSKSFGVLKKINMNFAKLFERPAAPEVERPRPIEIVKPETVTQREGKADVTLPAPVELKLENNQARIELPEVAVPDELENWFDAYAEILEYLDKDEPLDKLAAVGRLSQRAPNFAKTWVQSASADALQQILIDAAKEACELGNDCAEMLKSDKRDMAEKIRIKNQLAKHADILNFVEQADAGHGYKPAYEFLSGAAAMAGIAQ